MFVRQLQILVDSQVGGKPADQDIILLEFGQITDIINGNGAFHRTNINGNSNMYGTS